MRVVDGLRGCKGFVGNSSAMPSRLKPDEKPNYRNLRSQCYYYLAEAVNTRKIAVDRNVVADEPIDFVTMLSEELSLVRAKYADADDKKLQIIPKEEIKEALGRSPDFADAMMMRMYLEINAVSEVDPVEVARVNFNRQNKFKKYLFF
jgi:phage terminase large subunit